MPYSFTAQSDINASTIVKFSDNGVIAASLGTDNIIGISGTLGYCEGDSVDVYMTGERTEVEAGGTFSKGDAITANANGKAVKATSASNIIAVALDNAIEGDIVPVIVNMQRVISE